MADTGNMIPLDIPYKPPTEMTRSSEKASAAVAQQVMYEQQLKTLLAQMG